MKSFLIHITDKTSEVLFLASSHRKPILSLVLQPDTMVLVQTVYSLMVLMTDNLNPGIPLKGCIELQRLVHHLSILHTLMNFAR